MSNEHSEEAVAVLESPDLAIAADDFAAGVTTTRVNGVVLGRLIALQGPKRAFVTLNGLESSAPVDAGRVAGLTNGDIGRDVALMFEEGDPARPTIIGLIEAIPSPQAEVGDVKRCVVLEAETLEFIGEREIVLRCGEASVTLTREGNVLIRGAHLLSRSSGVNRIKGGSVHIN